MITKTRVVHVQCPYRGQSRNIVALCMWTTVPVHACERCSHAHRDASPPSSHYQPSADTSPVAFRLARLKRNFRSLMENKLDILIVLLVRKRLIHFTLYLYYQTHNTGKVRDLNDISPVLEVLQPLWVDAVCKCNVVICSVFLKLKDLILKITCESKSWFCSSKSLFVSLLLLICIYLFRSFRQKYVVS